MKEEINTIEKCWKVNAGETFVKVEEVNKAEKEDVPNVEYFDTELEAYKAALAVQNNVVNDLMGECSDQESSERQVIIISTILAVSLTNLARVLGNERLKDPQVWIEFANKVCAMAIGNAHTKDSKDFIEPINEEEMKVYLSSWFFMYLSRFCKYPVSQDKQDFIVNLVSETFDKCYETIFESNIENELKEGN